VKKLNIKIFLILLGLVLVFLNVLLISGQKPSNSLDLDDIYVEFHSVSEIRQGYIFPVTLIIRNLNEDEILNIKKLTVFDGEGEKVFKSKKIKKPKKVKKVNKNLKSLKKVLKREKELKNYLQSPEFCGSVSLVEAQPEYQEYIELSSKIKNETFKYYFDLDIRDFGEDFEVGDIVNILLDIGIKIGNENFIVSRENQIEIVPSLPVPSTLPGSSFGWYKGDLHMHSGFGPVSFWGINWENPDPLDQMVDAAKLKDLDWVIFTDHSVAFSKASEWEAGYKSCKRRSTNSFKCLYGQEMSIGNTGTCDGLENGHYLAHPYADDNLGWIDGYCGIFWLPCDCRPEQLVINEINNAGGMGFIAHPYLPATIITSFDWDDWTVKGFTGIEIINGDWSDDDAKTIHNPGGGDDSWEEFLQAETNPSDGFVVGSGGSDAHYTNDVGYGAFVYCYMDSLSTINIRNAVKEGHCVVSVGPFVEFSLNGAMIGDEVDVFSGISTLNISADSTGFGNLDKIVILIDGMVDTVIEGFSGTSYSGTVDVNLNYGDSYIRVEVYTDAVDSNRSFTNPIWVNIAQTNFPPNIVLTSATPSVQGFGEDVIITADIFDINGVEDVDTVLVGIAGFGESQTNYTMEYVFGNVWQYNFTDFVNGTYDYVVYVNDSTGLVDSVSGTFEMYVDLFVGVRTLKDSYTGNELVKIGDSVIDWTRYSITGFADEPNKPNSVYAIDMDSDGDIDVLSASVRDHKVAWYENNGSSPPGWTAHIITTSADYPIFVFAIDIDSDGDVDVLSSNAGADEIDWYENDGNENFKTHNIATTADYPASIYAIDVDLDGDIDVVSASFTGGTIAWYENDGNENFTTHNITFAEYAWSVFAIDLDEDGDVDVLSANRNAGIIAWYENNGSESFTTHNITTSLSFTHSVFAIDVDSDGDIDVLSASFGGMVAWYENDGNENFVTHVITTSAYGALSVFAIDVNLDGDIDVLSADWNGDGVVWYENNGSFPPGWTAQTLPASYHSLSVFAIDIDNDKDIDVISAIDHTEKYLDRIQWYEFNLEEDVSKIRNDGVTNVSVYLLMKVQYWNGTDWLDESIIYDSLTPIRIQPGIYNQLKLSDFWNPNAWDVSSNVHGSGTYRVYVAVTDENGVVLKNVDGGEIVGVYEFLVDV